MSTRRVPHETPASIGTVIGKDAEFSSGGVPFGIFGFQVSVFFKNTPGRILGVLAHRHTRADTYLYTSLTWNRPYLPWCLGPTSGTTRKLAQGFL